MSSAATRPRHLLLGGGSRNLQMCLGGFSSSSRCGIRPQLAADQSVGQRPGDWLFRSRLAESVGAAEWRSWRLDERETVDGHVEFKRGNVRDGVVAEAVQLAEHALGATAFRCNRDDIVFDIGLQAVEVAAVVDQHRQRQSPPILADLRKPERNQELDILGRSRRLGDESDPCQRGNNPLQEMAFVPAKETWESISKMVR